jgi:hypothetical protein
MLRFGLIAIALAACGGGGALTPPEVDARLPEIDGPVVPPDMHEGVPLAGFGDLSGACGVLDEPELTGADPALFRNALNFARRFEDPADRPLLTAGGLHMIETPNAGGSSGMSEVFAFEELARCELAGLLKTETEIVYTTPGKITDLEVTIDGHKIGVSVTRAVQFPFGNPYTTEAATTLIQRKLEDILVSSTNVSPEDRWEKQILSVLAYDDQHADVVEQVWAGFDAAVRADTLLVVTVTNGADDFIYTNN